MDLIKRAAGTSEPPVLRLVEPSSIEAGREIRLAVSHWLLATLPTERRAEARRAWAEHQVAMLPLGTLFSAVRLPGELVYTLADTDEQGPVDRLLRDALSGPVICDPHHGGRYYALVSARMPVTWRRAADDWRTQDVDVLGRDCLLGVPPVDALEYASASYWSSPMPTPGDLCESLTVARFIAAGAVLMGHGA